MFKKRVFILFTMFVIGIMGVACRSSVTFPTVYETPEIVTVIAETTVSNDATDEGEKRRPKVLYGENNYVGYFEYEGLDLEILNNLNNRYGVSNFIEQETSQVEETVTNVENIDVNSSESDIANSEENNINNETISNEESNINTEEIVSEENTNEEIIDEETTNDTNVNNENEKDNQIKTGCSITFAKYDNEKIGAVRNMDAKNSNYYAFEFIVKEGNNVKYPFWGLSYVSRNDNRYQELMSLIPLQIEIYNEIPYLATDTMSFGTDESGNKSSLYCAFLSRDEQKNENGEYEWVCSGTNKNASQKVSVASIQTMIAANCININQALEYVGAVNEAYEPIGTNPMVSVFQMNEDNGQTSNHSFGACALTDSTGRYGVLEFVDNYAIWHENVNYSFNYFIQEDYLKNEQGFYKESNGKGIGRYNAVVPYLENVKTVSDHINLMDKIDLKNFTFYDSNNKENDVDWESELTGYDVWENYSTLKLNGFDLTVADEKYPLFANYMNIETKKVEKVDNFDYWVENKDHLKQVYDLNYVTNKANSKELINVLNWIGAFYNSLSKERINETNKGWFTYFKVIVNPMENRITRWINGDITTSKTISYEDVKQ